MTFPQKLKKIRKIYRMSQSKLAVKAKISTDLIIAWEDGTDVPNLNHLGLLAVALETSIYDILEGVEVN